MVENEQTNAQTQTVTIYYSKQTPPGWIIYKQQTHKQTPVIDSLHESMIGGEQINKWKNIQTKKRTQAVTFLPIENSPLEY